MILAQGSIHNIWQVSSVQLLMYQHPDTQTNRYTQPPGPSVVILLIVMRISSSYSVEKMRCDVLADHNAPLAQIRLVLHNHLSQILDHDFSIPQTIPNGNVNVSAYCACNGHLCYSYGSLLNTRNASVY
jgi:hypothetical protein